MERPGQPRVRTTRQNIKSLAELCTHADMPPLSLTPSALRALVGDIDIYLFDQLLRGRITESSTVLDAGCGGGRNLVFLMRAGVRVFGVDQGPDAIDAVRRQAATLAPQLDPQNFLLEPVEAMTFGDATMDVVISSAVLHFARDEAHFVAMISEMWRVLAPDGLFFARLASSIGIEQQIHRIDGRRHRLPDGSERFLVDEELLMHHTARCGGSLLDPLKTTVVQGQRAMTTWVVKKHGAG